VINLSRPWTVHPPAQRGVALITALLIVALATVAAVAMATALQLELRRTGNVLYSEQAFAYSLGGEDWALGMLARDAKADAKAGHRSDALSEAWAAPLPPTDIDGGTISAQMEDLQGRFNLNDLMPAADSEAARTRAAATLDYFKRLLRQQGLDEDIAAAVADWLDPDVDARVPGGAEDLEYLKRSPPYRAANAPFVSVSELRLVRGVTPEVYAKLAPLVTALPEFTAINVNTAPPGVILALYPALDDQKLHNLIQRRQTQPFTSVTEAQAYLGAAAQKADNGPQNNQDKPAPLTALQGVSSNYFLVQTSVHIGKIDNELFSVIHRDDSGHGQVIRRSLGTD
jgi:general secretion pathway protein K